MEKRCLGEILSFSSRPHFKSSAVTDPPPNGVPRTYLGLAGSSWSLWGFSPCLLCTRQSGGFPGALLLTVQMKRFSSLSLP